MDIYMVTAGRPFVKFPRKILDDVFALLVRKLVRQGR